MAAGESSATDRRATFVQSLLRFDNAVEFLEKGKLIVDTKDVPAQSAEWQTRGWPIGEDVSTLAEKYKTFFFTYVDTSLPKVATVSPSITTLLFQRSFRHADGALMKQFWEEVAEQLQSPAPAVEGAEDA